MSRRKAFHTGEGTFVIADEFAEEVYIGIVEIGAAPATRRLQRSHPPAIARIGPVLVTLAFSLGAIIAGLVLARVWH